MDVGAFRGGFYANYREFFLIAKKCEKTKKMRKQGEPADGIEKNAALRKKGHEWGKMTSATSGKRVKKYCLLTAPKNLCHWCRDAACRVGDGVGLRK